MGLIECRDCGHGVSISADCCPNCGNKFFVEQAKEASKKDKEIKARLKAEAEARDEEAKKEGFKSHQEMLIVKEHESKQFRSDASKILEKLKKDPSFEKMVKVLPENSPENYKMRRKVFRDFLNNKLASNEKSYFNYITNQIEYSDWFDYERSVKNKANPIKPLIFSIVIIVVILIFNIIKRGHW
jgi:predicted  nucleic acid-binding Zn-ribbon protein